MWVGGLCGGRRGWGEGEGGRGWRRWGRTAGGGGGGVVLSGNAA